MRTFILTLDCDWAPDFVLEDVLARIRGRGAHATLFVTHPSPAVDRAKQLSGLELGWHPNFLPGSTQGRDAGEITAYLRYIAPEARSMRTHDLFQSTSLLRRFLPLAATLRYDASLFLPGQPAVQPFDFHLGGGLKLRRFPFVWEDDVHLLSGGRGDYRLEDLPGEGLCIVNFHPIHVYLNTADFEVYERMRSLGPMPALQKSDVDPFRQTGDGIGGIFDRALEALDFRLNLREYAEGPGAAPPG